MNLSHGVLFLSKSPKECEQRDHYHHQSSALDPQGAIHIGAQFRNRQFQVGFGNKILSERFLNGTHDSFRLDIIEAGGSERLSYAKSVEWGSCHCLPPNITPILPPRLMRAFLGRALTSVALDDALELAAELAQAGIVLAERVFFRVRLCPSEGDLIYERGVN